MKRIEELRKRAERYRRLLTQFIDRAAVKAISDLASEFEMTAAELEKRDRIRERAHQIWIERGRPEGCDVENWLAAEREVAAMADPNTGRPPLDAT